MDDQDFERIASYFFNQFLELKIKIDSGDVKPPANHAKELRQYQKAAGEFRAAAESLAAENEALNQELVDREGEISKLRLQLNEALMALGTLQQKLEGLGVVRREAQRSGYSFVEHMSEESRRAWEQLMRSVPYGGTKDDS